MQVKDDKNGNILISSEVAALINVYSINNDMGLQLYSKKPNVSLSESPSSRQRKKRKGKLFLCFCTSFNVLLLLYSGVGQTVGLNRKTQQCNY